MAAAKRRKILDAVGRGLTYRAVAKRCGVSKATVGRVVLAARGEEPPPVDDPDEPTLDRLQRIHRTTQMEIESAIRRHDALSVGQLTSALEKQGQAIEAEKARLEAEAPWPDDPEEGQERSFALLRKAATRSATAAQQLAAIEASRPFDIHATVTTVGEGESNRALAALIRGGHVALGDLPEDRRAEVQAALDLLPEFQELQARKEKT